VHACLSEFDLASPSVHIVVYSLHFFSQVEMLETSDILKHATERSLIIMDEIGRGTATSDGLAIAWATIEHIHRRNGSRSLFATHYHELANLVHSLKGVSCATTAIHENAGQFVFLHKIIPGTASGSYGLQVAAMAGFPECALHEARRLQQKLENKEKNHFPQCMNVTDVLLAHGDAAWQQIEAQLVAIDLDSISPNRAHAILSSMQLLVKPSLQNGVI
jgi:DNA mismatch repair protein MutS